MARENDLNLDAISKEPGAHPVGTGLGAAMGGVAAGAAAGAIGGPIGAMVGAAAGAIAGGLGGKAVAESVNPTAEEAYWRDNYAKESYYETGRSFEDYAPAYRMGVQGRTQYGGSFDETESHLRTQWDSKKQQSSLTWPQASAASRAAWQRIDNMQASGASNAAGHSGSYADNKRTTSDMFDASGKRIPSQIRSSMGGARADDDESEDVIGTLNDLVEKCHDGEYGFRTSAENVKSQELKTLLLGHAEECRSAGLELQGLIRQRDGDAVEGGSVSGALHRGWVSVRSTLSGYTDEAVLDECERGEDTAVALYRKTLQKNLPADIKAVVERQAQGVQRNHDQVKALRDSLKASH